MSILNRTNLNSIQNIDSCYKYESLNLWAAHMTVSLKEIQSVTNCEFQVLGTLYKKELFAQFSVGQSLTSGRNANWQLNFQYSSTTTSRTGFQDR